MINHVWSVLCGNSSIDQDSNQVSIFNILEQLTVFKEEDAAFELLLNLEILSLWTRESPLTPTRGKMRIWWCISGEERQAKSEMDIDLTQAVFFRTRVRSTSLHLKGSGMYHFQVELLADGADEWQLEAELPLLVKLSPKQ